MSGYDETLVVMELQKISDCLEAMVAILAVIMLAAMDKKE